MENTYSSDSNIQNSLEHLNSVLVEGETPESWAIQHRLFSLLHRRVLIAATTGRFIVIKRGIFGGFDMTDFRWQDLGDIKLKVGIFGADIFITKFASTDLAINKYSSYALQLIGFDKNHIQEVYRYVQLQDQSWREKRRVRELEEMRAKSGGFNIGGDQNLNSSKDKAAEEVPMERLKKAKEMLENKLISDSEYESIKARIITTL